MKEITDFFEKPLSTEAMALFEEIKTIEKNVDYRKLKIIGGNSVMYDFSDFKTFNDLFEDLRFEKMSIDDAEIKQNEFNEKLNALSKYSPRNQKYLETKNMILDNAKNFYEERKKIIEGFNDGKLSLKSDDDDEFKNQARYANIRNEYGLLDYNKFMNLIKSKENIMNNELVSKYFYAQNLRILLKQMKDSKNIPGKNKILLSITKSGLGDLKNEIKKMTEDEIKTEKPNEIVDIVEKILEFNEQQEGKGLKILTPSQMLSRLPISLAQLKAGNNSEKLKNETRQLLYSLYHSKSMSKQVYDNLIKYI